MPIRITGLNSGLDTEAIISELVSAYRTKEEKYQKAQTKLSWKQDAWKDLNIKVRSLYDNISNLRFTSAWTMKKTTVSDSTKATVTAAGSCVNGTQTLKIKQLAKGTYITGGEISNTSAGTAPTSATKLSELGYTGSGGDIQVKDSSGNVVKTVSVTGNTTIKDLVSALNGAGDTKASFDATNKRIFMTSNKTGEQNAFSLDGDADILKTVGLSKEGGASIVDAQDSEIELNGAKFTSANNTYTVNGLTIDCLAETGNSEISITTSVDTQSMYDQVKNFLSQYNSLMKEMYSLYNADSAKGYEPLTDSEKDQMTDTEVEKWEEKIKAALLRRDDTLDGIMSTMKNAMSTSYYIYNGNAVTYDSDKQYYKCNGNAIKNSDGSYVTSASQLKLWASANGAKKYSLSSFGIKTEAYATMTANSSQDAYHIDGDADDSVSKNNSDVLLSMLSSDPDTVSSFMKQLTSGLYSAIDTKMKSVKGLSSSYTIYNDIEMAREYSDYTDTISKWEDKLTDLEDSYYKKFAAMESALASLQSQSSSLSSLLS
ncbi:MAG: flagellar filament capping protein FliD [Lachnospiraceae bacterium]|nr:flagellar filament capping protein FliD [Lachnospiraceae bacterium]